MKKISKLLAILMAVVVFASAFAIAPSAISSTSSAKDILRFYENAIIYTSSKEDVIKAVNKTTISSVADFSSLTAADKKATIEEYAWEDYTDESTYEMYFYGDANKDMYIDGRSEFVDFFSINRDIKNYGLTFKSAKLSEAKNGDKNLTFVCTEDLGDGDVNTLTYTAKIAKGGYIKSYTLKQAGKYEYESAHGKTFTSTDTIVDSYSFVYKKVDVESIELSETFVELGKNAEYIITPIILPENATYKGVYVESNNYDVADAYADENGNVVITAYGGGSTTIEVYTYDGDFIAECEVVVHVSFFQMIIDFFTNLFESIFGFLMF